MGLLDSFFIQFGSNAKDTTKDVNNLDKATKDLQEQINKTDEKTAALGVSFAKLALAGVAALEGFASINKLKAAIDAQVDYNAEVEKTSRLTNVSSRELSIYNDVVAKAGGDPNSKEYLNFLRSLNHQYAELGVNQRISLVNRDLGEVADKIKSLNDQNPGSGYAFAQKLKIGDDLYLALKDGKGALDASIAAAEKLDNTTQKTTDSAFKLKQAWVGVGIAIRSATNSMTEKSVSSLTSFGNEITALFSGDFKRAFDIWRHTGQSGYTNGTLDPTINSAAFGNAPMGLRNNNPGNLQPGGSEASYSTLQDGVNAELDNLRGYGRRGINTLSGIAGRWAPPNENDTGAYIAALSKSTGYDPNQPLNLNDPAVLAKVGNGINRQENGAAYGNMIGADGKVVVNIDQLNVQTQATDAAGVSRAIGDTLGHHISMATDQADDGVSH